MTKLNLKVIQKKEPTEEEIKGLAFSFIKGDKGDKGDQGIQGEKGDQGIQGGKGEKGETGERGEKGEKGIQGEKGEKGERGPIGPTGPQGKPGKDGVSPKIEEIVIDYKQVINAPKVEEIVRTVSQASKTTSLSELDDVDISGLTQTDGKYILGGGGISDSFETVSANLSAYDYTINYNGSGDVSSIVYSNGVTKTLNYTSGNVTSIVLSGATPQGVDLTKTLIYTGDDVTSIAYS